MAFLLKYPIEARYLPVPSNRRRGRRITPGVRFIVAHDTGNPNSTAAENVHYFYYSPNISVSAHLFVDDKHIIECIPALTGPPEKAWHVLYGVQRDEARYGYEANDVAIGVEYCYGTNIDASEAYRRYVWVMAYICHRFALDPATSVIGHFMLDPHRKTDPHNGLAHSRRTYDQLLIDVVSEYRACLVGEHAPAPAPTPVPVPAPRESEASGEVCTTYYLNIRAGAPNRHVGVVRIVPPGTTLRYVALIHDGESFNGNRVWCRDADGNCFWSGATRSVAPLEPGLDLKGER